MTEGWSRLARLALSGSVEDDLRRELVEVRDRMIRLLGGTNTKRIWKECTPIKRGRVKGERTYNDPAPMVMLYDEMRKNSEYNDMSRTKLIDSIGRFVHETRKFKYGSTALGVSKALQRALNQRSEQEKRIKAESDAIRRNMLVALLNQDKKNPE